MLSREKFELIKNEYGHYASWAVWADGNGKPKDNVGEMDILNPDINSNLLQSLNPNVIIVGLNISGRIKTALANFHSPNSRSMDFKMRYAFKDTPLWGGYITDIIKDFEQKVSGKVMTYLSANRKFEKENIDIFRKELSDLGSKKPKLISCGGAVDTILKRNLKDEFQIFKIPHYSHFISKENYKKEVDTMLIELNNNDG